MDYRPLLHDVLARSFDLGDVLEVDGSLLDEMLRYDLRDLHGPAWVDLDGGTFTLGSGLPEAEGSPMQVTLSAFKIARFPGFNMQYWLFRPRGSLAPQGWAEGRFSLAELHFPVVGVNWHAAGVYCDWFTRSMEPPTGVVYLPTEAQWALVARGVEGRQYPWGNEAPTSDRADDNRHVNKLTAVNQYPDGAAPAGVYDMGGNTWEWCYDRCAPYVGGKYIDPTGPNDGVTRVIRGGAFDGWSEYITSSHRDAEAPDQGWRILGLGWSGRRTGLNLIGRRIDTCVSIVRFEPLNWFGGCNWTILYHGHQMV